MHRAVDELDIEMTLGEITTRGEDWGGQLVRHLDLPAGTDFRPLFQGLPGNACQCPHWGQVLTGSVTVQYADGTTETTRAGETYYWPGGHVGWTDDGVTFLEISPAAELRPVLEHLESVLGAHA